jgi:hypothetical protein
MSRARAGVTTSFGSEPLGSDRRNLGNSRLIRVCTGWPEPMHPKADELPDGLSRTSMRAARPLLAQCRLAMEWTTSGADENAVVRRNRALECVRRDTGRVPVRCSDPSARARAGKSVVSGSWRLGAWRSCRWSTRKADRCAREFS